MAAWPVVVNVALSLIQAAPVSLTLMIMYHKQLETDKASCTIDLTIALAWELNRVIYNAPSLTCGSSE